VDEALTMARAVDLALRHSRMVGVADADRRIMTSMRGEAAAGFWPQVSVNGYLVDQDFTPNVYFSAGDTMARNYQVFGTQRAQDLNVTAMWPLFSGGRTYYGHKAARARADGATHRLRGTELEVALQARLDYIAAAREEAQARVTGDVVRQTTEQLRVAREALEVGRVARVTVLRAEAELANATQMDTMARNRAALALVALKTTLGLDLQSAVVVAEPLDYEAVTVSVDEGVRQVLAQHPDSQAAAREVEAAEAEVRAALGRYFPEVSIVGMYDWQRLQDRGDPVERPQGYSAGVVLTLPVFDGFLREQALTTARAKRDKARALASQTRQRLTKAVHEAGLMLIAAEQAVAASRSGLAQGEEQFSIIQERLGAGRGTQLELLDAQAALARARANVVAALADHQTARALWLGATGRVR
jgi:outer membrane protein TolC